MILPKRAHANQDGIDLRKLY